MAQSSSSNLTLTIGADSSKMRADLAQAQAELRNFQKELRTAADAARLTGDTTQVQAAAGRYDAAAQRVRYFANEIRGAARAQSDAAPITNALTQNLAGMGRAIQNAVQSFGTLRSANTAETLTTIGKSVETLRLGLLAFAGAEGLGALYRTVDNVVKKLLDLNRVSAATQFSAAEVQGLQRMFEAVGVSADDANAAAVRFSKGLTEAQFELANASKGAAAGVTILTGKTGELGQSLIAVHGAAQTTWGTLAGPSVLHGVDQAAIKLDTLGDVLRALAIDATRLKPAEILSQIAAGILRLQQSAGTRPFAEKIGLIAFSKSLKEIAPVLPQIAAGMQGLGEDDPKLKAQIEAAKQYEKALHELDDAWTDLKRTMILPFVPGLVATLRDIQHLIEAVPGWFQQLGKDVNDSIDTWGKAWAANPPAIVKIITDAWGALPKFFADLGASIEKIFTDSWKAVTDAATAAVDWVSQKITAVKDAISSALSAIGGAIGAGTAAAGEAGAAGMAAGGVVRGPGTGTSDSILARLSAGEFVMRSAAVQRWGVGLMHGLNSFAQGGLVGVPPLRFADLPKFAGGGDVVAHFSFDRGSPFALHGPADVVHAMATAASHQQMRSAGAKPTWYGGRPGGR